MRKIDYLLVLGDVILGRLHNDSGLAADNRFQPYCQGLASETLSAQGYDTPQALFQATAHLVPAECRQFLAVLRCVDGRVVERVNWKVSTDQ